MRFICSGLNLFFLLCFLFACGCAETKKPVSTPSYPDEAILFVTSEKLNLRACPSLSCKVTAVLKRGDEMIKLGEEDEWIKVRIKNIGREGWVASRFAGKDPPIKTSPEITEEWSPHEKDKKVSPKLKEDFSH